MDKNNYLIKEFKPKRTKYCLGIPVINEGERIKRELEKIKKYSDLIDVIIFDGNSTDDSTKEDFLKKSNVNTLLTLIRGKGQSDQLRMGLSFALKRGYEGIITIDGNGKDDPKDIPHFIDKLEDGYDLILGSRFIKGGKAINTPLSRFLGIRLIHAPLISLAARRLYTDTTNGFRGYSRKYLLNPKVKPLRSVFKNYELYLYLAVRASQIGLSTKEIPVTRGYPKGEIPTKIVGFKKKFDLLSQTCKVVFGKFNPNQTLI